MRPSAPVSVRLSPVVQKFIASEARRTKRSKGWVIQALIEESMRSRLFPGIAFRGPDSSRRAWLMGTALDVWQVVEASRDFESMERMAQGGDISERQIRLALDYYARYPEEIDEVIADNRLSPEEYQEMFPAARLSA
jgi:uncharacterized protein (DUF433 family)